MTYFNRNAELKQGYNTYIDASLDDMGTQMDVGLLLMEDGDTFVFEETQKEIAVLLFAGKVTYRWNTFQLYDYRGVEEHLSAMAAQGWRLEKASGSLWKYRRAEPASLRYAVTYNAGASQFNPGPTEGQESLEELNIGEARRILRAVCQTAEQLHLLPPEG